MNKQEFAAIPETTRMNRVLEGEAYYACVHRPNMAAAKKFNAKPAFSLSLALDEANVKIAQSFGLKVHPADKFIPAPYVKLSRKVKEGKTPDDVKPDVVDTKQNKIPPSILIGNGSRVLCKFGTYWFDNQGGGVGTSLFKVQVKELVEFDTTIDRSLITDGTGYTVSPTDTTETEFDSDDGFKDPIAFDK